MNLYHGSNIEIVKIDLTQCSPFKDFGRGFYTTTLKEQAWEMAKRTVRIYKEGYPCITEFFFDDSILEDNQCNIKKFKEPNFEWAQFVANNRNHNFRELSEQLSFHSERSIVCLQKAGVHHG
jgi:hypothetical protein